MNYENFLPGGGETMQHLPPHLLVRSQEETKIHSGKLMSLLQSSWLSFTDMNTGEHKTEILESLHPVWMMTLPWLPWFPLPLSLTSLFILATCYLLQQNFMHQLDEWLAT